MTTNYLLIIFLCYTAHVSQHFTVICPYYTRIPSLFSSLYLAAKDKKGCSTLPRAGQDTSLFPVDEKAVEYYFASDARYVNLFSTTFNFSI